jgi:hypothetical protein
MRLCAARPRALQGMPDYALASAGGRVLAHSKLLHQPPMHGLAGKLARLLSPHELHPLADKVSHAQWVPPQRLSPCWK